MNNTKPTKMIESDGMSFEMWKWNKWFRLLFKFGIVAYLIMLPITLLDSPEFPWGALIPYIIILSISLAYHYGEINYDFKLYSAKMNDTMIILKRDGENPIKISWNEISSLSRLRFANPALYIMTDKKDPNEVYIFPTSANLLTFSLGMKGIGIIQRDFAKMGRHIRKMKKINQIPSFYLYFIKNLKVKRKQNVC